VNKSTTKPVIGIIGGVASGKSTVAAEFAKLGCAVIDADKLAHEALDNVDVKAKIAATFGNDVLDDTGRVHRKKLADIVFADREKLASLNEIVHPYVLARAEQLLEQYQRCRQVRAIVLDMPLLVEVGWDARCDRIVFVDCQESLRVARAKKIGICDESQLKARENFQICLDNKVRLADNIINNNSGLSELSRQVAEIFSQIVNNE